MLDEFVPRFNRRICLEQVLCFKHRRKVDRDNTVRFQLRTLQLLPAPERPSYAGATVEVLEGLDAQLKVRHEGRIIAAQEAPPSPVSLRNGHQPPAVSPVAPIGVNHWDERWTAHLAPLVSSQEPEADQPDCTDGEVAAAPPATVAPRQPTFLLEGGPARRKGMSLRAIERELGMASSGVRFSNVSPLPSRPQCPFRFVQQPLREVVCRVFQCGITTARSSCPKLRMLSATLNRVPTSE